METVTKTRKVFAPILVPEDLKEVFNQRKGLEGNAG